MEIILFLLGCIGFTHIIVDSSIIEPLRNWFYKPTIPYFQNTRWFKFLSDYLFSFISKIMMCYQCAGFWCGLLLSYLVFEEITFGQIFAAACASSFLSMLAANFSNYLDAASIIHMEENEE